MGVEGLVGLLRTLVAGIAAGVRRLLGRGGGPTRPAI